MEELILMVSSLVGSSVFLLFIQVLAFSFKLYTGCALLFLKPQNKAIKKAWLLLFMILLSASLADLSWIVKLSSETLFGGLARPVHYFFLRIAWAFTPVLHQSIALFLVYLTNKKIRFTYFRILSLAISGIVSATFLMAACCLIYQGVQPEETALMKLIYLHTFFVIVPAACSSLYRLSHEQLPKILKKQALSFITIFIFPYLFTELLSLDPWSVSLSYMIGNYGLVSLSTLLLTYALYQCSRKMIQLRFLNFRTHVQANKTFNFIDEFSYVLEQLSCAEHVSELLPNAQNFFKNGFSISPQQLHFIVRDQAASPGQVTREEEIRFLTEQFFELQYTAESSVEKLVRSARILITDELEFSNFYADDPATQKTIAFLKKSKADIFIPLYNKQEIAAYILIDQDSRPQKFFSSVERDEMLIFVSYMSNTLNLLQQNHMQEMLQHHKELKDDLHEKRQEIKYYKESIQKLLHNKKEKEIGIIFYKNRRFSFANRAAQEIVSIDLNKDQGHPLAKACRKVVENVLSYKSVQTASEKDAAGRRFILQAVPSSEQYTVLVAVYYPDLTDLLVPYIEMLKDPTRWDYLLYLETTDSGQLINALLPSSTEHILNFKLQLLKATLTRRATLLTAPKEDALHFAQLIHRISLRKKISLLTLTAPEKNLEIAIKLFGITPLYGTVCQEEPLLVQLRDSGTLYIENIHFLSRETQQSLAYFIRYGFFMPCRGNEKITSSATIIASSSYKLDTLVHEQLFCVKLAEELEKNHIIMPSLVAFSEKDLENLTDAYVDQVTHNQQQKKHFMLTEKEKSKLVNQKPASIHELKVKVEHLLQKKSKRQGSLDYEYRQVSYQDQEVAAYSKLGKHALKDPQVMSVLWQKFKNQNKIALLLGVNRSSVNRRCKDYRLL